MQHDNLTIRSLRARAVEVSTARPLFTAGGQVSIAPLVLVDLHINADEIWAESLSSKCGWKVAVVLPQLSQ